MQIYSCYPSPLGEMLLRADEHGLSGAWFFGGKYIPEISSASFSGNRFTEMAIYWLDIYFSGKTPEFFPKLHFTGSEFRKTVLHELCRIEYGKTVTYGDIANRIAESKGSGASARAVGGAVSHNPLSVFIPCHRVVSADGNLTGYAGGIERKIALLKLEGIDPAALHIGKRAVT
jgi:methylated-DNA-[protein]-cysteine S-methyltransferase